ncbi:hypothetical protein GCM10007067_06460 [Lysobacter bugurensis]|uniref:Uncharacterized protein n=1 Tax=Cognatilysobacter bugurensis TaxID=543356 RepID=A0A918SVK2_9GAMM|nr:hypothetical protein GCM10007067_06460 [Lysobacter bugurensis]
MVDVDWREPRGRERPAGFECAGERLEGRDIHFAGKEHDARCFDRVAVIARHVVAMRCSRLRGGKGGVRRGVREHKARRCFMRNPIDRCHRVCP